MSDQWDVYFRMEDDCVESVAYDLGIAKNVPISELPWLLQMAIPLKNPNEGGLTTTEEAELLDKMEELVESSINKNSTLIGKLFSRDKELNKLIYVGRITGGGVRIYNFYGNHNNFPKSVLQDVATQFQSHPFKLNILEDPRWVVYLNELHPGSALAPLFLSRSVLEVLEKDGDQLQDPRDVNHTIFFKRDDERKGFLDWIKKDGWQATLLKENVAANDADRFGVVLTKKHRIDRMWSDIHVVALCSRANKFNGRYDGWGCFQKPKGAQQ